jgi:trk system potassium uptake protein TrkH
MNYRLLAKVLGLLLLLEGVAMGACALFARYDVAGDGGQAVSALLTAGALTVVAAAILISVGIGRFDKIPRREAVVIVGLGWLLCGLFGGLPYVFCEPHLSLSGAVFESVSGFTTTGSTVMTDITLWPRGVILWRATTQWLGGLGILVLFVAVLSYLGVGSKSLFRNESSFQTGEATTARIRDTALMLWKIYLAITLLCTLGLRALGLSWFNAVAHAFTAVSTGGFSPHNESVGYYSGWQTGWAIEAWLTVVMAACSMNFLIYVVIVRRAWKRLRTEEDGRWFLGTCLAAMLLVAGGIALGGEASFWNGLRQSSFTVISIASTTGFGTADYEGWPVFGQAVLAALMVVGGCSGSTAGGMKISRMLVFMKTVRHEVVRAFRPNQVFRMSVNGNSFDDKARQQTLLFIALYGTILGGSAVIVGLLEAGSGGIDLVTCLSSALATLSNIGPAFGSIGPTENFAHFRPGTQVFLSLLMVLGRLELFAILVLFIPAAWRRY